MISCSRTIKRQIVYSIRPFQIQRIDALFNYPIDTKERGKPGCLTTKFKPIIHELKLICMRKSLKRVCSYPELIHVVSPFFSNVTFRIVWFCQFVDICGNMHQLGLVAVKISHGGRTTAIYSKDLLCMPLLVSNHFLTKQLSKVHPYRKVSCIGNQQQK